MVIKYQVTGDKRKQLANAIAQELQAKAKYLGVPTFAYEVGGYSIDKNGTLTGEDNWGLVAELQGLYDFKAVSAEYDIPLPTAEPISDNVQIPYEAEFGGRVSPYKDYEEPPAYGVPQEGLTIEMPREAFTDTAIDNLKKLVASKLTLIKKAIGAEHLPIIVSEETISFPWFQYEVESEAIKAYTHFIVALCDMAKTQKRVNGKETTVENEKFAFRTFLLRLGFIGPEYKEYRKILLKNLSGSSAYANGGGNNE